MVIRLHYPPTESRPECGDIATELVPEEQNVKNIRLRCAIALLVVLGAVSAAQAQTPPEYVYKLSRLSPDVIFANGFLAPATHPMDGPTLDLGRHLQRGDQPNAYVSTTATRGLAVHLGEWYDEDPNAAEGSSYWIYTIVPDATFVDVDATVQRTITDLPADSGLRAYLQRTSLSFPFFREYAAQWQIAPGRIISAEQFNARTGVSQGIRTNEPAVDANPTAAIHPNNVALGHLRDVYYGYTPPAAAGNSVVAVPEGFLCGANGTGPVVSRRERSTDSTGSGDCPDIPETVVVQIPLNTPAGFGSTMNFTTVPPGDYRQWVDVDGDGLTDLCVLYVTGQPYPYVRCYRDTRPVPNAASTAPQLSADAGIFTTNMLVGTLAGNLGPSDSWSFVNVTGNPGDIAFCRVIQSTSSYKLLCGNFPKSATVAVTPVAVQSANLPGIYPGGGQWVSSLTGNGKPAFCFPTPKTITRTSANLMTCSVATGTGFAAPIQTSFTDLGYRGHPTMGRCPGRWHQSVLPVGAD